MTNSVTNNTYIKEEIIRQNFTRFEYILQAHTSCLFLVFDISLVLLLFYFHYLMIRMLKRESKARKGQELIKELLQCYSIMVPVTFTGAGAYFDIMTRYLNTPSVLQGFWFCVTFELYVHISTIYIGGFSLYIASLKYWRIVHNPTATKFVEYKARKICFVFHLIIPILTAILNSLSNGKVDQIFSVDHCWSIDSNGTSTDPTMYGKIKSLFCVDRNYEMEAYFGKGLGKKIANLLRVLCGSVKVFHLFVLSNLMELILYILIFRYLDK